MVESKCWPDGWLVGCGKVTTKELGLVRDWLQIIAIEQQTQRGHRERTQEERILKHEGD